MKTISRYVCLCLTVLFVGVSANCGSTSSVSDSNNSNGTTGEVDSSLQILASNIVFRSAQASEVNLNLDTETQIYAENVVLDTTATNTLASDNLQDALDNEIAVDLDTVLIGTWTIANAASDTGYGDISTGSVTFDSEGAFEATVAFAAAGLYGTPCEITPSGTYTIYGDSTIVLQTGNWTMILSVIKRTNAELVIVGDGGCGAQGVTKLSVLSKTE